MRESVAATNMTTNNNTTFVGICTYCKKGLLKYRTVFYDNKPFCNKGCIKQYRRLNKMEQTNFEPRSPDYAGSGISIWEALDKNGHKFLRVKVLNMRSIPCFRVEKKKDEPIQEAKA